MNYHIKEGYRARDIPERWTGHAMPELRFQHHVYLRAAELCDQHALTRFIEIGPGDGDKAHLLVTEDRDLIAIAEDAECIASQNRCYYERVIVHDLEKGTARLPAIPEATSESLILCADVIEHLVNPAALLAVLRSLMDGTRGRAPLAILSTPERDLVRGRDHIGPPPNAHHVREWNQRELCEWFSNEGFVIREWRRMPEFWNIHGGEGAATTQCLVLSLA